MNKTSDEVKMELLRTGSNLERDQVLKSLYREHYRVISIFVKKNKGTADDAADIFQDAIFIFYEKVRFKKLELSCSIGTYLYSVCRYLWLNRLRSRKEVADIDDQGTISIPPETLSILDTSERNQTLAKLVEHLGKGCKRVLYYFYFDRLKMAEIAIRMGLSSEQAAKNKKADCIKRLKKMILESSVLKEILK